jgi:hypothetical protein
MPIRRLADLPASNSMIDLASYDRWFSILGSGPFVLCSLFFVLVRGCTDTHLQRTNLAGCTRRLVAVASLSTCT